MHEEQCGDGAIAASGEKRMVRGQGDSPHRQRLRGFAGRLRPYADVRAGFEPWRRVALRAWALRRQSFTVH